MQLNIRVHKYVLAIAINCVTMVSQPVLAQCVAPGTAINFTTMGNNTAAGYTTIYILTDNSDVVLKTVASGFGAPNQTGTFKVYTLNYNSSTGFIVPTISMGVPFTAISGSCVSIGGPFNFCVAAPSVAPSSAVAFATGGQTSDGGYATNYVLTDASGNIISSIAGSPIAAPAATGNYLIYTVNYGNGSAPSFTPGSNISSIGGACKSVGGSPVQFSVAAVLPVTLVSFTANLQSNKTTALQWNVAEQSGIKNYVVEKSVDGNSFSAIGSVAANNLTATSYDFNDASLPAVSIIYYKLKIVGVDGAVAYSQIVTIKLSGGNFITLYPNPAKNYVWLQGGSVGLIGTDAYVTDMQGRAIGKTRISQWPLQVNTFGLADGIYLIKLEGNQTLKMVVGK